MELHKALGLAALFSLILLGKIGCIGLALWFEATYPAARGRMLENYRLRRRKCIVTGTVNAILGTVLIMFLFATKVLALVGLLLLGALVSAMAVGYGLAYRDLGVKLDGGGEKAPYRITLLGGLVLEAAYLAPVAGQILALIAAVRGLGAVIIALMTRNGAKAESRGSAE